MRSLHAAIGLFTSVVLHEVGHAVVARRKGCRAREILLLPIGGVAQLDRIPTRPVDEFQVAIAGPAVSLFLALACQGLADLLSDAGAARAALTAGTLAGVNLMLVLFNLLPSFPMDGGRIFRAWLTPKLGRLIATQIAAKAGRFMAVVFGIAAIFYYHNIFLLIIAIFIYQAAGAEYRMVRLQEAARQQMHAPWMSTESMWPYEEDEVLVSPPPYRRGKTSAFFVRPLRVQHDLFDDLFEKWR